MISNFIKILCLLLAIYLTINIFKKSPRELISDAVLKFIGFFGEINYSMFAANKKKATISKKKTFTASWYYTTAEKMLADLELNNLTVEAFSSTLAIISLLIDLVLINLTGSLLLGIVMFVCIYMVLLIAVFMSSIQFSNAHTLAVLDSEDLLISTIRNGFINSVRTNINGFPKQTKIHFEDFLADIDKNKVAYKDALSTLRDNLGPVFHDMYLIAIPYETDAFKGADEEFSDILNINTKLRVQMLLLSEDMKKINSAFAAAMLIIVVFGYLILGPNLEMMNFLFKRLGGQILLSVNLMAVICGFGYLQIHARGFKTRR